MGGPGDRVQSESTAWGKARWLEARPPCKAQPGKEEGGRWETDSEGAPEKGVSLVLENLAC